MFCIQQHIYQEAVHYQDDMGLDAMISLAPQEPHFVLTA